MDTSKNYYESVMRNFKMYGRGRSLEQFCCDEGVDHQWLTKAKKLYAETETGGKKKSHKESAGRQPDLIRLHFDTEGADLADSQAPETGDDKNAAACRWIIASLTLTSPSGRDTASPATRCTPSGSTMAGA